MNMKKTIATLLVLAVVMTGVFADPTSTTANVQLAGTVKEGSGVIPGTGEEENPIGVSVWGDVSGTLTKLSETNDLVVVTNAKINSMDDRTDLVTEYLLGAYFAGNYNTDFMSTVTITPAGFKLDGSGPVIVGVTAVPTVISESADVVGKDPVVGGENGASKVSVDVNKNTLVASKTKFANFKLEWTPVATAVAGDYTCDVEIAIASNR